jgi:transcriptional regulator with XRE-family HTH domain
MAQAGKMANWKMKQRNFINRLVSRLRNQRGWTQDKFAVELQLVGWHDASRDTVAKLEGGSLRVDLIQICYLAAALGVPPARILSEIDWGRQIKKLIGLPLRNHNQ